MGVTVVSFRLSPEPLRPAPRAPSPRLLRPSSHVCWRGDSTPSNVAQTRASLGPARSLRDTEPRPLWTSSAPGKWVSLLPASTGAGGPGATSEHPPQPHVGRPGGKEVPPPQGAGKQSSQGSGHRKTRVRQKVKAAGSWWGGDSHHSARNTGQPESNRLFHSLGRPAPS